MIEVDIASKALEQERKESFVTAFLPLEQAEITEVLLEAGAIDGQDCSFYNLECQDRQVGEWLSKMDLSNNSLDELNFLAFKLQDMSKTDLVIYSSLTELYSPDSLKECINLTADLDGIHFVPEVTTAKELGGFLVENDFVEIPQEYWKYLDYEGIGNEHLATHTAAITKHGYIEDGRSPAEVQEIYDGTTLPQLDLPQHDMGQEMGF